MTPVALERPRRRRCARAGRGPGWPVGKLRSRLILCRRLCFATRFLHIGLESDCTDVNLFASGSGQPETLVTTFFGRPASTFRGPARLALATGATLIFGSLIRAGTEYRVAIDACEEPERRADGIAARGRYLTESWVRRLEACVRETPEQYLWFHRRWKGWGTNQENST